MKKFIYTMALGLALGMSAGAATTSLPSSAATSAMGAKDLKAAKTATAISAAPMKMEPVSKGKKNIKRSATPTVADFAGTYVWGGENALTGVVFPNEGVMTITQTGAVSVSISGFVAGFDLSGRVENGRLYIPNQYLFFNEYFYQDVWFNNMTLKNGEDSEGNLKYNFVDSSIEFFFSMDENGNLMAGEPCDWGKLNDHLYTDAELESIVCVPSAIMPNDRDGYFFLCQWIEAVPTENIIFRFNPDEWESVGMAEFKDAWFPVFWQDGETPAYEVPLYQNRDNHNQYLLLNPYGQDTPYGEVNYGGEGYLLFDMTDPDCVTFRPFVHSITSISNIEGHYDSYYCFNEEGYNTFIYDADTNALRENLLAGGLDVSCYDNSSKTVTICNPRFSIGSYFDASYWSQYWDELPMPTGYVRFPDSFNPNPQPNPDEVEYYIIGSGVNGNHWVLSQPDARFQNMGNGIYRWSGEILGSEFKINNGSWDDLDYNLGSDYYNPYISLNTPYSLVKGGYNITLKDFDCIVNPVVELDTNNLTVTIVGGEPTQTEIEYCWLVSSNIWIPFEDRGGGQYVINAPNYTVGDHFYVSVVMSDGSYQNYGAGASGQYIYLDETYSIADTGHDAIFIMMFANFDMIMGATVELDMNNQTISFSGGTPYTRSDNKSLPDKLYIVTESHTDEDYDDRYLTPIGNGIYSWSGNSLYNSFYLRDIKMNSQYLIAANEGETLTLGEPYDYVAGYGVKPFKVDIPSDYIDNPTILLDLNDWQITVTSVKNDAKAPKMPFIKALQPVRVTKDGKEFLIYETPANE